MQCQDMSLLSTLSFKTYESREVVVEQKWDLEEQIIPQMFNASSILTTFLSTFEYWGVGKNSEKGQDMLFYRCISVNRLSAARDLISMF